MQHHFEDAVKAILARHPEYQAEAYHFMREALDAANEHFAKNKARPHITAQELFMGCAAFALEEYGPMARYLLNLWGIYDSKDIGAVVYNLIEVGIFGKQEGDSQEQFDDLPSLEILLDDLYTPQPLDTNPDKA